MALGDYLVHEVEDANGKLKEKLIDPSQLPTPGDSISILRGNSLFHKQTLSSLSEGDYAEMIEVQGGRPMCIKRRYDGENWIPENIFELQTRLKPSSPVFFDLTDWIEHNIVPMTGELPDKGVFFEFELQFWMNHYYEDYYQNLFYHRTLTATKCFQVSVLKTNNDNSPYVLSEVKNISFAGAWVEYESSSVLYFDVLDSGDLDASAFPVSIEDNNPSFAIRIDNALRTFSDWETIPDWEVKVLIRARVKEYSSYDRTNEIIK